MIITFCAILIFACRARPEITEEEVPEGDIVNGMFAARIDPQNEVAHASGIVTILHAMFMLCCFRWTKNILCCCRNANSDYIGTGAILKRAFSGTDGAGTLVLTLTVYLVVLVFGTFTTNSVVEEEGELYAYEMWTIGSFIMLSLGYTFFAHIMLMKVQKVMCNC